MTCQDKDFRCHRVTVFQDSMYTCVCVCDCVCVYVCVWDGVCVFLGVGVCAYGCVCIQLFVHTQRAESICVYLGVSVCICVYLRVSACICVYLCPKPKGRIVRFYFSIYIYVCVCDWVCVCVRVYVDTAVCQHAAGYLYLGLKNKGWIIIFHFLCTHTCVCYWVRV